jgi:squalene-associated FAD-dependent desaturase
MDGRVIIVGGGLAGLSAAAALAGRGLGVTLLEARPRWGGRASSFVDQTTGEPIDNCQHVNLGCGTNFQHFCRTVGIDPYFVREERLTFVGPDGRMCGFGAAPLPAPLHLFPSLLGLRYLTLSEKWQLARGLRRLARTEAARCGDESFLCWLQRHGQSPAAIERFWHVVLVSALSETLDRIDVAHARKVFVDAFLANRHGWEVWLPTVALDELYGKRIEKWFAGKNVVARLQTGVRRIDVESADTTMPAATGVELRSGERLDADHVIVAVPQNLVLALLPDEWRKAPELAGIEKLEAAPISSVHVWFDRPITDLRHAVLVGRLSQWMFNRSAICARGGAGETGSSDPPYPPLTKGGKLRGEPPKLPLLGEEEAVKSEIQNPKSEMSYYQVVISASREVLERGQEETIREVVEELAEIWPAVRGARLVHSRLVTEHKAVVSMLPGVERFRPAQQSPIGNLQLAGDWTKTGWPGTMEGAVRSGYLAAENVLRHCGSPETLVQPDLPVALLSKLFFGL